MKQPIILLLLLTGCIAACTGNRASQQERTIAVTMEPLRYFTEAIAGDRFEVVSMVPKGSGPETYDPTPRQLVSLSNSVAYIRIGYIGFEVSWMDRILANNPGLPVYDTSKGIELIEEEGHFHGDHYHAGGIDPHTWNSTVNARIIAENIYQCLVSLDEANTAYYQQRYDSLLTEIDRTETEIRLLLAGLEGSVFIIYHPALTYFARDYGLEQICIEEDGKQPSPSYLRSMIHTCREKGVKVIFIQEEFDIRNAEIIAEATGTRTYTINPLNYDWQQEMVRTAHILKESHE
ncbi:MAG: zinc ABC transporter substrate-binding protein [Bacteroides sp.]|nr:zinc ABC transporter substrate-binding protein [Bacteroides sp.]